MNALLIVPPYAMTNYPSLAAHSLQAIGRKEGFDISVFYASLSFASLLGGSYEALCSGGPELPGESSFAAAAWGLDAYGEEREKHDYSQVLYPPSEPLSDQALENISRLAVHWIQSLKEKISQWDYPLVGITSSYEQTNASVAIAKAIKEIRPETVTFIGGYNAEAIMAEGMESLDPEGKIFDYIFSGESEESFAAFLRNWKDGIKPENRIIKGNSPLDLDGLPLPEYGEYFRQLEKYLPEEAARNNSQIALESSRGCWWGEKSHCLFCGYADERLQYREKSQERFLGELKEMEKYPSRYGHMADLIMPRSHFDGVIPRLTEEDSPWTLYYEQRAAWKRPELELLEKAGIRDNQPGIETLSSRLLGFMGKGTNLKNNLTFLREATGAGNRLYWNFVWGFPGEKAEEYREMGELIPRISHLIPPMGVFRLALSRFSPLFQNPEKWGISNIRPLPAYGRAFPDHADLERLAYFFISDYEAETFGDPSIIEDFISLVDQWNEKWESPLTQPRLVIARSGSGELTLVDTRNLGHPVRREIDGDTARFLIENRPADRSERQREALDSDLAIEAKGDFIPLVTIENQLRKELLNEREG